MSLSTSSVPVEALAQCLRDLPACVVLRNDADLIENLHRGGDVDLLVADPERAERTLVARLGQPVRIVRSSYVTGYSYDWGHLDLLPAIEWRGASYLRADAVLEDRQRSATGRPVPRLAHEAAISWLTSLLWGGFFKERYRSVIHRAVETDGVAFRDALVEAAGPQWGTRLWTAAEEGRPEASAQWVDALRRAVWWRALVRSPMRTLQRYAAFVLGELRRRLDPPAPWIVILGAEGSRSPSAAEDIVARLPARPYASAQTIAWRPERTERAHGSDASNRGPMPSGLESLRLAAEWLVRYWTCWVHLRAKGYVVVLNGTCFESVAAGQRERSWLQRGVWRLVPKPDVVFRLAADDDVGQRADEVLGVIRRWMVDRFGAGPDAAHAGVSDAITSGSEQSSGVAPALMRGDGAR